MSPKQVREKGGADNSQLILSRNVFGWFEKVRKGVYAITTEGRRGLLEYPELEKYYTELLLSKKNSAE